MGSNTLLIGIVMIIIGCVLTPMAGVESTPIYHFYSGLLMIGGISHIGDYFTKKSYAIYSNTYMKTVTVQRYLDF